MVTISLEKTATRSFSIASLLEVELIRINVSIKKKCIKTRYEVTIKNKRLKKTIDNIITK